MIYKNHKELQNLHIGDNEIQRVLLGERLIWENYKLINIGTGKFFNIKELYPNDYQEFTNDNFFIYGVSGRGYVSGSIRGDESGPVMGMNSQVIKSYNATTGILSCYLLVNGESTSSNSVNVSVAIIPNVQKALEKGNLIYLGKGWGANIKSHFPNDYQNMSVANFMIGGSDRAGTGNRYYGGSFTCGGYGEVPFSYNAETGQFNVSCKLVVTNDGGGYLSSQSASCSIYVSRKPIV